MMRAFSTALIALCVLSACVEVEPDPPVDEDGEPIPLPGPYDRWLEIAAVSPAASTPDAPGQGKISLSPSVAVTFNDYIEDDSFDAYAFGALSSGGVRASGDADYIMTDKAVVFRPWNRLEPGLMYHFNITGELVSATDAPFWPPAQWPRYEASREAEAIEPPQLPDADWTSVEAIVEEKCADCHRQPDSGLNPLTYESLVGVKSEQTDLFLVRPHDAPDSYLMRKLLWDYPDVEFVHQPPKWAGGEELAREELLTIEGWIAGGARR